MNFQCSELIPLLALFTDDKFQQLQQTFLDKHYMVFEDVEENKLVYTDIHRSYVNIINSLFIPVCLIGMSLAVFQFSLLLT